MQVLPIVEREMRVAARTAWTWWRRVLTTGVAFALWVFLLLAIGEIMGPRFLGQQLFVALTLLATVYALLSGAFTTADCLSRERREGTLGLLFLTDLHSYDVVLGKMGAASLNIVLDLVAVLPIAAIPILMGGVSLTQLAFVALALANAMFLSLALGTCASALTRSGRSALAFTLGILFFLAVGLVILGEGFLGIQFGRPAGSWFYMLCPIYGLQSCFQGTFRMPRWDFWLNLGATHLLGWLCLLIATCRTATAWRDLPASALVLRWRQRLDRWRQGTRAWRIHWRAFMLDRNPVSWLEGRNRLQERVLWGSILVAAILGAIVHLLLPDKWPDEDALNLWPLLAHYALCVWIAIQAPRRLADDRESGALELLLCTPVQPPAIVRGCMTMLRRRFGRALLALLALDLLLACLFCLRVGGWEPLSEQ